MKPVITVAKSSNVNLLKYRLKSLNSKAVYVGIPASSVFDRKLDILQIAKTNLEAIKVNKSGKLSKKRQTRVKRIARSLLNPFGISNAQLLYIHTKGSLARHIPARPVIEPAIVASGNKEAIAYELGNAAKAVLEGKAVKRHLQRAGIAGANASKRWFTDPRNGWPPNAPATIRAKRSDRPLIDTGALRASITYVVKDE